MFNNENCYFLLNFTRKALFLSCKNKQIMGKRLLAIFILSCLTTVLTNAQKVIVYFDDNLGTPPSVSKAILKYNKDFAYSFTFDDGTSDAFSHALPLFQGGKVLATTLSPLYYTDGCGNDIPFRGGIAWNSVNSTGVDVHTGEVKEQLTWKQLDTLYDKGWDIFNHSYSHRARWTSPMLPIDYYNEIVKNQTAVKAKTSKKIEMPVFVVPSGDDNYQDVALDLGNKIVFDQSAGVTGYGGFNLTGETELEKLKLHRQIVDESLTYLNILDKVAAKSTTTSPIWYNEFTHRIDATIGIFNFDVFKNHIHKMANTWGKNGTDRMWMAPLQEVYEYLVFRKTVKYTSQVVGKTLEISFDLSQVPTWLRRKVLTLVINSNTTYSRVDVPETMIKTFKGTGTTKILNLDFTNAPRSTGTKEISYPSVFRLFPNPVDDVLTLEMLFETTENMDITVSDALGKTLKIARFQGKTADFDVKTLPSGLYFISLKYGNQVFTDKIFKK
jgi:peptidoglycan/xylan/chitin deacetylase (PgdA/CDA1 family)